MPHFRESIIITIVILVLLCGYRDRVDSQLKLAGY